MKPTFSPYIVQPSDVSKACTQIDKLWTKLSRFHPHDDGTAIGLPYPYVVPSLTEVDAFTFNEMYYWDSYFIIQGLLGTRHQHLAIGIVTNLCELYRRFRIIPTASRFYFTGKSQPPLLSSMILDVYEQTHDLSWLAKQIQVAKEEYRTVWLNAHHPNDRLVYRDLSRFYHVDVLHDMAESESGWDHTPRFMRRCLDFLPIDLNCLLYKYEIDFAKVAVLLHNVEEGKAWLQRARHRKAIIDELCWNSKKGFYFDYDYANHRQGHIWSLAGYFALWSGMATDRQAHQMMANLDRFEFDGGLAATAADDDDPSFKEQWSYPNGWAPLHFMTVYGLLAYGYKEDSTRIARKWIKNNLVRFLNQGYFYEKYNVVRPDAPPKDGLYPSQIGFGWTNGVFYQFCQDFMPHYLDAAHYQRRLLKHQSMAQ